MKKIFFTENLQHLVGGDGVKFSHMAAVTGISESVLRYYVSGHSSPTLYPLCRIADYLGVPIDALVYVDLSKMAATDMPMDQLKAEAKRQGYRLVKSTTRRCQCYVGREQQLKNGRKKCLEYEYERSTKNYCYCRRKETENDTATGKTISARRTGTAERIP